MFGSSHYQPSSYWGTSIDGNIHTHTPNAPTDLPWSSTRIPRPSYQEGSRSRREGLLGQSHPVLQVLRRTPRPKWGCNRSWESSSSSLEKRKHLKQLPKKKIEKTTLPLEKCDRMFTNFLQFKWGCNIHTHRESRSRWFSPWNLSELVAPWQSCRKPALFDRKKRLFVTQKNGEHPWWSHDVTCPLF